MSSNQKLPQECIEANIVIIGSGGGLAAAVEAAEHGATGIVVLEKNKALGGDAKYAGGIFGCESPVQKRESIIADKDECFKTFMKWTHWHRVNPRIVRAYLNKSGDTIRWLEDMGLEFDTTTIYPNQHPRVWHIPRTRMGGVMKALRKTCEDKGVKLFTNTSGKKILRGPDGNITGIIAERDGEEFQISAKSVIIATGGFHCNRELLKKYCPDYFDGMGLFGFDFHCHMGDGLLMAEEIGAAIADSVPIFHEGPDLLVRIPKPAKEDASNDAKTAHDGPDSFDGGSGPSFLSMSVMKEPYMVWVNKIGKRFCDETVGFMRWEAGNAILLQPDREMYCIFDDATREKMEQTGLLAGIFEAERKALPGLKEKIVKAEEIGACKISDTWEGIADWMGADPQTLRAEIDEYNSYCKDGYDAIFSKERRYLSPLLKAPFYALRASAGCGETTGGIKVSEHMEVLDTQGNIIQGLYAAGVIADGWQAQTYCSQLCGSSVGFAINSGRIAGESAAKFTLK